MIFLGEEALIPVVDTWVYLGFGLDPKVDDDRLYFQDAISYWRGIRRGSANEDEGEFQVREPEYINQIFQYERALEVLMTCSLRRAKHGREKLIN